MRERLFQLLPEIGVTGVTGVSEGKNYWKHCIYGEDTSGTLLAGRSVTSVSSTHGEAVHLLHRRKNDVYQENINKISVGTPLLPGTPIFVQGSIEAYEERAAIMEFDSFDTYLDRKAAGAAAYKDCSVHDFLIFRPPARMRARKPHEGKF